MTPRYAIGIDIGGTQIKGVCVRDDGSILAETVAPTNDGLPAIEGTPAFAVAARSVISELSESVDTPPVLGIAAPGLAAKDSRSIAFMPGRMKGLERLCWDSFLKRTPVPVLNDAHAALLGEVWTGAAAGARDAILLTLGTGVGGAILSGGRLLKGAIGRAGHLGHITVNADGPLDIVQTPGSLEDAIGECTLSRRSDGRFHTTRELLRAAQNGDDRAQSVWQRSLYLLASAIASLANTLDPETVILGGGIAQAGPALFEPLAKYLDRVEWRPNAHRVRLVPALLADRAGALGAAWNALQIDSECKLKDTKNP